MIRSLAVLAALVIGLGGCALSPPNPTAADDFGSLGRHFDETTSDLGETLSTIGREMWSPSNSSSGRDADFLFTDPEGLPEGHPALAAEEQE
jgi:hypothetical protein